MRWAKSPSMCLWNWISVTFAGCCAVLSPAVGGETEEKWALLGRLRALQTDSNAYGRAWIRADGTLRRMEAPECPGDSVRYITEPSDYTKTVITGRSWMSPPFLSAVSQTMSLLSFNEKIWVYWLAWRCLLGILLFIDNLQHTILGWMSKRFLPCLILSAICLPIYLEARYYSIYAFIL